VYQEGASDADSLTETTGRLNEGPNGTVEVDVPLADAGKAKRGDVFRQPHAETDDGFFIIDQPASEFDYQVGLACSSSAKTKSTTQVKGTKQVRGGVLPATGVGDGPYSAAGLGLIALASLSMRRLRLAR
jgi:LPXTG-motif cell wall-anchored protein